MLWIRCHLPVFRKQVESVLAELDNMSLIRLHCGSAMFVAGLFNEEPNGLSEAVDTMVFVQKFHRVITDVKEKHKMGTVKLRYAVCTGGPIYGKLLMDNSPISLISGDPISMASTLIGLSKPGQLLMDRTTYECLYGVITADPAGDFEFAGQHTAYYAIDITTLAGLEIVSPS